MEDSTILCSALLTILLLLLAFKFISTTTHKNLPPTPLAIPLIGHLHLIKPPNHRTFLKLSQKYDPVISLRFGYRLVVVVSSSSAAEECFTKNDIVLANRPRFIAGKHFYNYSVLVLAPYGDHWRNLRRICATEIFSSNRLKMFQSVRKDEIKHLLLRVSRVSNQDFEKVELKSAIMDLAFNNIMRMISGKRYYRKDVDAGEAGEVRELIAEIFKVSEATNLVDFLPMLKVISKFEKNAMNISRRMDGFLQKLVNEHRVKEGEIGNTMIDHLLSLQESEPEYYTDEIIKGLIWVC